MVFFFESENYARQWGQDLGAGGKRKPLIASWCWDHCQGQLSLNGTEGGKKKKEKMMHSWNYKSSFKYQCSCHALQVNFVWLILKFKRKDRLESLLEEKKSR